MSAPLSTAVLGLPNDVAVMRVDLVDRHARPGIVNRQTHSRAAVHADDRRVLAAGLESGGFDHSAIEQSPVGTLEADDFTGQNVVLLHLPAVGFAIDTQFGAVA